MHIRISSIYHRLYDVSAMAIRNNLTQGNYSFLFKNIYLASFFNM
ncbi:hypothetical protein LX99_05113 [Mucilaginibacter oryzae]|uniref:Uncharacterized protein n=1 Tax=Mucilaginibacter oryzae TaxID=468058 RepID=A0A316GPX3_9SPHI|nr:hypothetical protein LX99_05113 [Mucilaginibacter oryzae]